MKIVVAIYVFIIFAVSAYMSTLDPSIKSKTGMPMTWSEVKDNIAVSAKPKGVWTWAFDYVRGPALIGIEAKEGDWSYGTGKSCGPDGDLNALLSRANLILPAAPLGALLVKIGGSTAGVNDGIVRIAGSRATVYIDEKVSGPIFLTINDELSGLADNTGELKVKISIAQVTQPSATDSKPAGSP